MSFRWFVLALALVSSLALAAARPENKWRLEFSGGADTDGQITFALTPEGESEATTVTVPVVRGTGENAVAARVVKVLRGEIGKTYHVERDDGEDVLIKRKLGGKRLFVAVVENTVKGVRIHVERE